ncbi:hypothetical protein QEN19_001483 [Hanseniaspora menglaensis]
MSESSVYLDELSLVKCLEQASNPSLNIELSKQAEEQLKIWQEFHLNDGTLHLMYQNVYLDLSNPINVRWLAVINFKRIVEKEWKKLPADVKLQIRSKVLDNLDELNKNLCIQNALAISRMARLDFPANWESMLDDFNGVVTSTFINCDNSSMNSTDRIKLYNLLTIINQVVKTVSGARIGKCRTEFQKRSGPLFSTLHQIYSTFSNIWFTSISTDSLNEDDLAQIMEISYMSSKVLRRLIVDGFQQPHLNEQCNSFYNTCLTHLLELTKDKQRLANLLSQHNVISKIVIGHMKTFFKLKGVWENDVYQLLLFNQQTVQWLIVSIMQFLNNNGEYLYSNTDDNEIYQIFYKIAVYSFRILSSVIQYCSPKNKVTMTKYRSDTDAIKSIKEKLNVEIFNNTNFSLQFLNILISYYLKLTPKDLELMTDDAEEWANEELELDISFNLRKSSEFFFIGLLTHYQENTEPILVERLNSVNPANTPDYLAVDALYTMFELGTSILEKKIEIDSILINILLPLVSFENSTNTTDIFKIIIIRRICGIISNWVENISSENCKVTLYSFLLTSLKTFGANPIVSSSSLACLISLVEDTLFEKQLFKPFVSPIIEVILDKVLPTITLPHTRINVLKSINIILSENRPLVENDNIVTVLKILPSLWQNSLNNTETFIVAQQLVRLTTSIVRSLNESSYITWDIALMMIAQGIDSTGPNLERYNLLGEESFELLQEILDCFPLAKEYPDVYNKGLSLIGDNFLKNFMISLETSSDFMPVLLNIFKLFAVILPIDSFTGSEEFKYINNKMCNQLSDIRDDLFETIYYTWDHLLLVTFNQDPASQTQAINWFVETKAYEALFKKVFLQENGDYDMEDKCFNILSRLFFLNAEIFLSEMSKYFSTCAKTKYENDRLEMIYKSSIYLEMNFNDVLHVFINKWYQCISLRIYSPKERKLNLIAFSSIYRLLPKCDFYNLNKEIIFIKNFMPIASLWIEFLEGCNEDANGDCDKYHKIDSYVESYMDLLTNSFKLVKTAKIKNDIAFNIPFKKFVHGIINECILQDDLMAELWNSGNPILIDDSIRQGLELFLK